HPSRGAQGREDHQERADAVPGHQRLLVGAAAGERAPRHAARVGELCERGGTREDGREDRIDVAWAACIQDHQAQADSLMLGLLVFWRGRPVAQRDHICRLCVGQRTLYAHFFQFIVYRAGDGGGGLRNDRALRII
ncbi:hypothetical protein B4Q13_25430, partial [Lacticaseibacillus rhamnosus]